jgi:hypothetical protein
VSSYIYETDATVSGKLTTTSEMSLFEYLCYARALIASSQQDLIKVCSFEVIYIRIRK